MNSFLSTQLDRSLGPLPNEVRPVVPSRFEMTAPVALSLGPDAADEQIMREFAPAIPPSPAPIQHPLRESTPTSVVTNSHLNTHPVHDPPSEDSHTGFIGRVALPAVNSLADASSRNPTLPFLSVPRQPPTERGRTHDDSMDLARPTPPQLRSDEREALPPVLSPHWMDPTVPSIQVGHEPRPSNDFPSNPATAPVLSGNEQGQTDQPHSRPESPGETQRFSQSWLDRLQGMTQQLQTLRQSMPSESVITRPSTDSESTNRDAKSVPHERTPRRWDTSLEHANTSLLPHQPIPQIEPVPQPTAAPSVTVSIGRIEFRTSPQRSVPPVSVAAPQRPSSRVLSLEDYMRQKAAGAT